jgi:hypothetical protein
MARSVAPKHTRPRKTKQPTVAGIDIGSSRLARRRIRRKYENNKKSVSFLWVLSGSLEKEVEGENTS